MKSIQFFACLLLVNSCYSSNNNQSFRIVCYFGSSSHERKGDAQFTVENIDPNLCTHMIYSYALINFTTNQIQNIHPWREFQINGYENFVRLKIKNPQLKVMISLREPANTNEVVYSNLIANNATMKILVTNIKDFLDEFKFDGLELELLQWTRIKVDFAQVLRQSLPKNSFVLSAGSDDLESHLEKDDVLRLGQNLDFIDLQTYEYYYPDKDQNTAVHHAPLYDKDSNKSVDFTVNSWIAKGFPPDKIIVGIALFGHSWTLSSNKTKPPAPAKGPGGPGKLMEGLMAYYEICHALQNKNWKIYHDVGEKTGPYAVSPIDINNKRSWVGYDDPAMAIIKSNYIISKGLGGIMVRDVSLDDFRNKCGGGTNPIINAIFKTLSKATRPILQKKMTPSVIVVIFFGVFLFVLLLILIYVLVRRFR